ncbi:hypothetical protein WJX81_000882 [Elliptochloris bilobata]|uniref:SET domain-containing protein n=1 Tax=Elliptochloris bilobata TaxID=381761 RepID=A0AAW1RAR2_9CHLO
MQLLADAFADIRAADHAGILASAVAQGGGTVAGKLEALLSGLDSSTERFAAAFRDACEAALVAAYGRNASQQHTFWVGSAPRVSEMLALQAIRAPGAYRTPSDNGRVKPPKGAERAAAAAAYAAGMEVRAAAPLELERVLAVDVRGVAGRLRGCQYVDLEALQEDVAAAVRASAEAAAAAPGVELRRGKLIAMADAFSAAIGRAMEDAAAEALGAEAAAAAAAAAEAAAAAAVAVLPESILANREPYLQGDWRKEPYIPRPYVRLQTYELNENREVLAWKFRTQKRGQCSGEHCTQPGQLGTYRLEREAFQTECTCLARNLECGERCGCAAGGRCLNRAVSGRRALALGADVVEINSWGFDCYTRRNIHDAVLESQAFGAYRPDYAAALKAKDNQDPLKRGETLHHEPAGTAARPKDLGLSRGAASPRRCAAAVDVQARVVDWVERALMPAISAQGRDGWDVTRALAAVKAQAKADGRTESYRAAAAVAARVAEVGPDYFRIHPKGVGMVVARPDGLPPLTFVEEYLGEVHAPWRWFEIQDAIKKGSKDELPDFYNIVLERPRDDPSGYDCLFIDAAAKGAFASRMSHSCTPNCQAVVMACDGRLTIAVYTLRHVAAGEELTFDYASVTESEKEFRSATCLCGTRLCRGSFLYFAGSRAFMQVMLQRHNMLQRQVLLLRATCEPVTDADRTRLEAFGLRECALGGGGGGPRVPAWLEKWAALALEYVAEEQRLLPEQLLALPPALGRYTPASAVAEAKGVSDNRLQNVVITLDKVKLCLQQGQCRDAPLRFLRDDEVVEHLWTGERSIAKRLLRAAAPVLGDAVAARAVAAAAGEEDLRRMLQRHPGHPNLQALAEVVLAPVSTRQDAREALQRLEAELRLLDAAQGGGHTAAADMVAFYAATSMWFIAEKNYKGFASPPVILNMDDLGLDRTAAAAAEAGPARNAKASARAGAKSGAKAGGGAAKAGLAKKYGPGFIWGQLNGWYKQTVYDPTASLSAERRGTVSLPDIDSCYGTGVKTRYTAKERESLFETVEKRPDAMWRTSTVYSFRNEAKGFSLEEDA